MLFSIYSDVMTPSVDYVYSGPQAKLPFRLHEVCDVIPDPQVSVCSYESQASRSHILPSFLQLSTEHKIKTFFM